MSTLCFVAYYRISTDQQSKNGLGLEVQRAAVAQRPSYCGLACLLGLPN